MSTDFIRPFRPADPDFHEAWVAREPARAQGPWGDHGVFSAGIVAGLISPDGVPVSGGYDEGAGHYVGHYPTPGEYVRREMAADIEPVLVVDWEATAAACAEPDPSGATDPDVFVEAPNGGVHVFTGRSSGDATLAKLGRIVDSLRMSEGEVEQGREARDREIRRLLSAGVAYQPIQDVAGLSRAMVSVIRRGG